MTEPKFTPGPWTVGEPTEYVNQLRIEPTIGVVYGAGEEIKANANLIAAAPELYEALEYVMTAHGEQLSDAFEKAQTALAKARGESHD